MKYIILIFSFINILLSCAVCYGDPNHPVSEGMNNAILFLLFVIAFVLLCIATSIAILIKRTKKVELTRSVNDR